VALPAHGQSEINLKGAIDFHVHPSPDSVLCTIDADDLARLAKENAMRGLVLKKESQWLILNLMTKTNPSFALELQP
jgi:hypothetical protein